MADPGTDTDTGAGDETTASPLRDRLGECSVCYAGVKAKYRCPGCSIVTCSLACSKQHKQIGEGCSGKRKVGEFRDIRDFTDADLVSDYRFLEDALLEKDRAKRWRPAYKPGTTSAARADRAPANNKTVDLLTQKANERRTQLFCMPDGMARRVANTTIYDRKRNLMQWRVEWLFQAPKGETVADEGLNASPKNSSKQLPSAAKLEDAKVDETQVLSTAMRAHLTSGPGRAARLHELRRFVMIDREKEKKKALPDDAENKKESNAKSIGVFLAAEGRPANDKRFYKLDPSLTLQQCLQGKRVLEFPTLHVAVLPDDEEFFPQVEEDE